jgi:hypothetical protein
MEYLLDATNLKELKNDPLKWRKTNDNNTKRIKIFDTVLKFGNKTMQEMLNQTLIKRIIPLNTIKAILAKPSYTNNSIYENMQNCLVTIQGKALEVLIKNHIKPDMKFRDTIDSMNIELNNPFARKHIRYYN